MDLRDPRTQRWILIGLAVFAVAYVYLFTAYLPVCLPRRAAVLRDLRMQEEDLTRKVRDARNAARNRPRLEAEVAALRQEWKHARASLPDVLAPDQVLREVSVAAQESNVTVALVRPDAPKVGELYVSMPATVEVSGRYPDLALFLGKLSTCPQLLSVSSMRLTGVSKTESGETVHASLRIMAYALHLGSAT
jgi:Tfp pilus assembly protein PilO